MSVLVLLAAVPDCIGFKMLLEVLSKGTPPLLRIKAGTLLEAYLLVKLFICFAGSYSRLLMADITLLVYITGWAALDMFRNLPYDKDFKENNLPRFPFSLATVNVWFRQAVQSSEHATRGINMLNLQKRPEPTEYPKLNEAVFPPREENMEGFTMLYHGTTAHEHAKSIIDEINLSKSGEDGDFSCGKGFYVTKNFERAEKAYAGLGNESGAKAAVLAFKIPNDVLESFRKRSLDLMGEDKKDRWVTTTRNIREESKKYNFIEGPEMRREHDGTKTYEQLPGTHQMCILEEKMAKAFDRHLHSVVFYNDNEF